MTAPGVVDEMVTSWVVVYVPEPGLKVGVAARGSPPIVYVADPTALTV